MLIKEVQIKNAFRGLVVISIIGLVAFSCSDPIPRNRQHVKPDLNQTDNVNNESTTTKSKTPKSIGYNEVLKVVDGDTFWILNDNNERKKIRLIGMDTPEVRNTGKKKIGYYGKEASEYVKNLLEGGYVMLEYDVQLLDRYQRTLAYAYLEDGTFLNDLLVREGYAKVATFPPNVKYVDLFIESEKWARERNLGLWNTP